jgi:hypothetical protein
LKTHFAALNFTGAAAIWLQTVQRKGRVTDWDSLCALVFAKFDKDQYQTQLRHLESLKQTGTVSDYQRRFEELAHGILLYNPAFDDTFLVTKFVGGLKEEIRSAILLHRPKDVDTASALALIQEEELEHSKQRHSVRITSLSTFRTSQTVDKHKPTEVDKLKPKAMRNDSEDKLAALKSFRRKNGLCFKCGEKWGAGHKCPNQISIHVLEELLEAVDDIEMDSAEDFSELSEPETVMAMGSDVPKHPSSRKTMRLCGTVGAVDIMILVDSGSVGSFISKQLADQLKHQIQSCPPANFVTADGTPMICDQGIPQLQWSIQGHTFVTSVGVLPLKCYDLILGQDWLEECSPMWVQWTKKIMRFQYRGSIIKLQGIKPSVTKCTAISAGKLKGLMRRKFITHCV